VQREPLWLAISKRGKSGSRLCLPIGASRPLIVAVVWVTSRAISAAL
jgi:hypothetical protein